MSYYTYIIRCADGSLYTVFYARIGAGQPARIYGMKWRIEK